MPLLFSRHGRRRMGSAYQAGIHLNFATGVHYVKPAGGPATIAPFTTLFTFTGGNQSMYRGASGLLVASATNTPRIEYDANGNLLGLLIEGARTNSCLQSSDQGTTWTQAQMLAFGSGSTLNSTATLDPAGTNTADLLTPNTVSAPHTTQQTYTSTATSWTISFFYKPNGYTKVGIREVNATAAQAVWTCTGAGSISDLNAATATIQSLGNGWYRCTMTYTGTAAVHNPRIHILDATYVSGNIAAHNYTGDGVSGGFIWGVQYEAGAFASSYIPTTTGSVARVADVCTRTFGSEFIVTAGTTFAEFDLLSPSSASSQLIFSTNGNGRLLYNPSGAVTIGIFDGTTAATAGTLVQNVMSRAATGYNTALGMTIYSSTNGTPTSAAFDGSMVGGTAVGLGQSGAGGNELFGHIRRLDYWPERKANAELQRLTS